ncbi:arylsulfatase-like [Amphiura filiformis]|uniref:arylsulfatase-like n=1 Tax=Amphiura filiformis TaxID=82378 RepID=UPI003B20BD47
MTKLKIVAVGFLVCAFAVIKGDEGFMSPFVPPPGHGPPWSRKPNIIIFNADDMGWGDLSSYGHPTQEWGPVDDMAADGMRFTDFYSPSSLFSPSRAGLLTARIPERVGLTEGPTDGSRVFWHSSTHGLPKDEITLAEALKDNGYNTGFIGKWHLGVNEHNHTDGSHLPHNHGFDYVGHNIPLSNLWECEEEQWHADREFPFPAPLFCYLYNGTTNIQQPYSHYKLSEIFVDDAVSFMRTAHQEKKPFFLYYGLLQTHVNLYSNEGFRGSSRRGRYGDNIREMSWSVGAIMEEVKRLKEDYNTISIFTSDNGPLLSACNEGGDAGILKGGKLHFWEGGVRVPGIFHWPGHIRPGSISETVASQLDIFPTLMQITVAVAAKTHITKMNLIV